MRKVSKRNKAKLSQVFKSERAFLKRYDALEDGDTLVLRRSKPFVYENTKVPTFCFVNIVGE